MKPIHLRRIIIFGTVLLVCLLVVQVYWFSRAFNVAEKQFDHSVQVALKKVADSVARDAEVKKLSSNFFFASTGTEFNEKALDTLIKKEFSKRNLNIEYELGVYDADDDTLVYGIYVEGTKHLKDAGLSETAHLGNEKNFAIYFPQKRSYLAAELDIWIFSTMLLLLMSGFFAYAISTLLKERRFSDLKNDFINNMTHEFRTPVTNIGIVAEILKQKGAGENQTYVDILLKENEKLRQKIDTVLLGATAENINHRPFEAVDVHQLIKDCAEAFQLKIHQRDGTLQLVFDASASIVFGDHELLSYAINNVIDNAEKYSPKKPNIVLTTRNSSSGIEIVVKDSGVGIPSNLKQKVFEKFFRVPSGDVHNVKGFGLGLAFVQQVIKRHKGEVKLISEIDKGTEVKIVIPTA